MSPGGLPGRAPLPGAIRKSGVRRCLVDRLRERCRTIGGRCDGRRKAPLQRASPIETETIVTAVVVWCAVRGAIVLLPPPPWEPATGLLCVAAKKGRVGQLNRDKEQKETKKKWFMCGTFPHSLSGSKKKKYRGGQQSEQCFGMWKSFLTPLEKERSIWSLDGGTSLVWCALVVMSVVTSCVWCT